MLYPTRKIGDTQVEAIGWGTFWISYGSGQSDEECFKVLDRAYELGMRHWDSADLYQDGEELIGKWFRHTGKREDIFIATKFGFSPDLSFRANAAYVYEAVERSLKRLGVSQIDLYYAHRVDPKVPIEETVGAMAELVKQGKVKYIGLSEPSSNALRRAHAVHPISAVQVEYSPFALDIENPKIGLRATCRELGIPIIAYSPLGRGILTGKFHSNQDLEPSDYRRLLPMMSAENFARVKSLADALAKLGARHNATASQVCLAWLLAQGSDIIPIPGTRQVKWLEENARAVEIVLTEEEVAAVRNAAMYVQGIPRLPEDALQMCFQDSPLPKGQ